MTPTRVLVADPPWPFRDRLPGKSRGAVRHYPLMRLDDIARFPLPTLAEDAYLLLWRVASMQEEALFIAKAWGFCVKAELVWRKVTASGGLAFGMGHHLRGAHEVCLLATRGRPKPKSRAIRTVFDAPLGEHSAKPEAFYAIAEQLSDGPYVELFARRQRPGWLCYGGELLHPDPRFSAPGESAP